jgi:hypothetical protein
MSTTTLYRPIGSQELALVEASGWREFPPRLPDQPVLRAVTSETYARQIAHDWNAVQNQDGLGFVARFAVSDDGLATYAPKVVGAEQQEEYEIPAEDLAEFNAAIEGRIEIIGAYGVLGDQSDNLAIQNP